MRAGAVPFKRVASFGTDLPRELAQLEANVRQKLKDDDGAPIEPLEVTDVKTANYTARFGELVRVDPTAGEVNIYLPRPDDKFADVIVVANVTTSTNNIRIRVVDSDVTVDLTFTTTLQGSRSSVHLFPDRFGKNWIVYAGRLFIPAGNEGDFYVYESGAITPVSIRERLLDNTYSPVGNWALSAQSLSDSSGNGNTLSVETGTERYTYITPTRGGFLFDGSTRLYVSSFVSALAITGAVSFLALVVLTELPAAGDAYFVTHAAAGELSGDNALYGQSVSSVNGVGYLHEHGAGVNDTHSVNSWVTKGQPALVGFTRTSGNVVQMYVNGRVWGTASAALTAPDGGGSGRFYLGGFPGAAAGSNFNGTMMSACLYASTLTADQMIERFNFCLGRAHGQIT